MSDPSHCTRRVFTLRVIAGTSTLAAASLQPAQAADKGPVTESDPYAKSMGFRLKTADVDQVKFPRHDETQHCSACQLYSGKEGDALGPCSFYGGRLVPPTGWCRNFKVRKAKA
jgi:High potential iron-sulfur protein